MPKFMIILSYLSVCIGSFGMIIFSRKFPLTNSVEDHKSTSIKYLGLNGYQFWSWSWGFILFGTVIQLIDSIKSGL